MNTSRAIAGAVINGGLSVGQGLISKDGIDAKATAIAVATGGLVSVFDKWWMAGVVGAVVAGGLAAVAANELEGSATDKAMAVAVVMGLGFGSGALTNVIAKAVVG